MIIEVNGKKIIDCMLDAKCTVDQLATEIDCHPRTIKRILNSDKYCTKYGFEIANALNVYIEDISSQYIHSSKKVN